MIPVEAAAAVIVICALGLIVSMLTAPLSWWPLVFLCAGAGVYAAADQPPHDPDDPDL